MCLLFAPHFSVDVARTLKEPAAKLLHFYSERREDVSGIRNVNNGNSKIALKNGRLEISLPYNTTKHDGNSKSALEN